MDRLLKILVGTASIAIICATSWYGYREYLAAQERAVEARQAAWDAHMRKIAELDSCRAIVAAMDAYDARPAKAKFGTGFKDGVQSCRYLIWLDGGPAPKPTP